MKVQLERINKDYLFEVRNEAGRSVILDNKSKTEGKQEVIKAWSKFGQLPSIPF